MLAGENGMQSLVARCRPRVASNSLSLLSNWLQLMQKFGSVGESQSGFTQNRYDYDIVVTVHELAAEVISV